MEFCPNCGTRLTLKRTDDKAIFSCSRCNFQKGANLQPFPLKKVVNRKPHAKIVVIGKEEQKFRTMPTATTQCPQCGNNLAYTWQVQTRSADEGSTQFFRCTECNHTFRLYT